jgi:3-dehydroquinate synthase
VAQTDAAIGGKTGVDLATGKNLVGAFHQPRAVIADVEALTSLSVREFRSGLAEVVKYGIICDAGLFGSVVEASAALRRRALASLEPVVLRCCEIKARVVSEDETEQGLRAILNFGHTVGHAVEAATGYRRFRHGEAVAIGMVSACLIGEGIGVTPREVTGSVVDALERFGLPTRFPGSVSSDQVLALLGRDKKALAGIPRFVLARKIGDVVIRGDVPPEAVVAALERQRGIGR